MKNIHLFLCLCRHAWSRVWKDKDGSYQVCIRCGRRKEYRGPLAA